jgi:hypothetical protein
VVQAQIFPLRGQDPHRRLPCHLQNVTGIAILTNTVFALNVARIMP